MTRPTSLTSIRTSIGALLAAALFVTSAHAVDDAEAARAADACGAAARAQGVRVVAVQSVRAEGWRRLAVVMDIGRSRPPLRCRWDRYNGRTEFPGGEFANRPAPGPGPATAAPAPIGPVPATPDMSARGRATQLCLDLAQTRMTQDAAPPRVVSVSPTGRQWIDVGIQTAPGTDLLRCRFDVTSGTARWL